MMKALPVAAKSTAPARNAHASIDSPDPSQSGTFTGFRRTTSWIAPSGQTEAQKMRPKSSVKISGSRKNPSTVSGIVCPPSKIAIDTFWTDPIAQTHPSR